MAYQKNSSTKSKMIFHRELAEMTKGGPIQVTVKFPLKESTYHQGQYEAGLVLPGDKLARFYVADNDACQQALNGVTGNITIQAFGDRDSATLKIGGAPSTSASTPAHGAPQRAPQRSGDPIGDLVKHYGRMGRLYQLALQEGERQRAEYNQNNQATPMTDAQFQAMVSFFAIGGKDTGLGDQLPL